MTVNTIEDAKTLAREYMGNFDPSHDYAHVDRVLRLATKMASEIQADVGIVSLAALFHDFGDKKYAHLLKTDPRVVILDFCKSHGIDETKSTLVADICERISYRKEVAYVTAQKKDDPLRETCKELWCVQDADKLDALGAIGIMRCAAYSAVVNTPLYLGKEESHLAESKCAVGHFYDKLFNIKDMMKTQWGRQEAERRTDYMKMFVEQISTE